MDQYKLLVDSLRLLAAPYTVQRAYLPAFIENVQEDVVAEFDNAFKLVPQLMEGKKLSYQAVNQILHCYVMLCMNLENEDLGYDAFETHEAWETVRNLARQALRAMGTSIDPPKPMGS